MADPVERSPDLYLLLTEAQAQEVSLGQVSIEVQAMAKSLIDGSFEELLRKNAAKPVQRRKGR